MDKRNKSGALDLTAWEALRNLQGRRRSKYGNTKVEYDGYKFDSIAEMKRYQELKKLVRTGKITDLVLQPKFMIRPAFTRNRKRYRAENYVGDFMYTELPSMKTVVEDVKSIPTARNRIYVNKRNQFIYQYTSIEHREVM